MESDDSIVQKARKVKQIDETMSAYEKAQKVLDIAKPYLERYEMIKHPVKTPATTDHT